jgi:hypothetical protein
MADRTRVPREKWIPEIPFDVAEWGDTDDPYAKDGIFENEADRRKAEEAGAKLRTLLRPEDRPND